MVYELRSTFRPCRTARIGCSYSRTVVPGRHRAERQRSGGRPDTGGRHRDSIDGLAVAWTTGRLPPDPMEFRLATADLGNAIYQIRVTGEVDLATAPELKDALATATRNGARGVLVDLSHATFIDSTTLGVLMGAVKRLRPQGGELAIACNDANIRKIFEITLLDRIFNIYDTPQAGIAHLQDRTSTNTSTSTNAT